MPQSALARASLAFALGLTILMLGLAAWLWTQPGAPSIARIGQQAAQAGQETRSSYGFGQFAQLFEAGCRRSG